MYCINCERKISKEDEYCKHCGYDYKTGEFYTPRGIKGLLNYRLPAWFDAILTVLAVALIVVSLGKASKYLEENQIQKSEALYTSKLPEEKQLVAEDFRVESEYKVAEVKEEEPLESKEEKLEEGQKEEETPKKEEKKEETPKIEEKKEEKPEKEEKEEEKPKEEEKMEVKPAEEVCRVDLAYLAQVKTLEEAEKYLGELGLKANCIVEEEDIPFLDEKVGTIQVNTKKMTGTTKEYLMGETVNVYWTKYISQPLKVQVICSRNQYAKYRNETIVASGTISQDTTAPYYSFFVVEDAKAEYKQNKKTNCGYQLYMNQSHLDVYTGDNISQIPSQLLTFQNDDEEVTFKMVAPYVCTKDFEVVNDHIVLAKKTFSVREIYELCQSSRNQDGSYRFNIENILW